MSTRNELHSRPHHGPHRRARGPSSYAMHDADLVFRELALMDGDSFLDLGCGPGEYALHASKIVGGSGVVYALDKWKYLIDGLVAEADVRGLTNIRAMICDITDSLPIENRCADVCLLATVLHALHSLKGGSALFSEIHRVLKPAGRVAIIECKKEDQPFGPPEHMRLSAEEVEKAIAPHGFNKIGLVDLGYNYLIQFRVE